MGVVGVPLGWWSAQQLIVILKRRFLCFPVKFEELVIAPVGWEGPAYSAVIAASCTGIAMMGARPVKGAEPIPMRRFEKHSR